MLSSLSTEKVTAIMDGDCHVSPIGRSAEVQRNFFFGVFTNLCKGLYNTSILIISSHISQLFQATNFVLPQVIHLGGWDMATYSPVTEFEYYLILLFYISLLCKIGTIIELCY
jgi:hypothetical protein